ncbi:hypothetical protein [Kutzneria buriramensis]|uniref:Uncharacterized protein n=1 Tax=Kutzneria buriramensis TaxID=1045776 RepID=A0A3E0GXU7_9PSEU|nr:hypothetical protein [Kutzneria buriramensis]REH34769.1 hypothetical protein BCF44_11945 [Kutzneria buriramensis]
MSQLAGEPADAHRVSMPGRLRGVLAVLVLQVLGNGFVGWVVVSSLSQDGGSGTGLDYLVGYLSLALAVLLVLCIACTVRPQPWVRPTVITIQALLILSGVVNLVAGSLTGFIGIGVGIAVIGMLNKSDVRNWYEYGPFRD